MLYWPTSQTASRSAYQANRAECGDLPAGMADATPQTNRHTPLIPPVVASNTLRIPVPSTRAEAVTYLAEIKTEIDAVRMEAKEDHRQIFRQADTLLGQSKDELARNNYDTACLLASQAMELIHTGETPAVLPPDTQGAIYTEFIAPLQLEVVKRSNIRTRPGTNGKPILSLQPGTPVTASGYKGNWIKVKTGDGHEGWIYFTLLKIPQPS